MFDMKAKAKAFLSRLPAPDRRNHLLTVHRIGSSGSAGCCTISRIDQHLRFAIDLLGRDKVSVFFDDAYASAYECAVSLVDAEVAVHIAVPTAYLARERQVGLLAEAQMPLAHLERLLHRGAQILPHGHTHISCHGLSTDQIVEDIHKSLKLVQEFTGIWPTSFVFPYGHFDARLCSTLVGFGVAVGYGLGRGRPRRCQGMIIKGRFCLENSTSISDERFALSRLYAWL